MTSLGVSMELPPETAQQLRRRRKVAVSSDTANQPKDNNNEGDGSIVSEEEPASMISNKEDNNDVDYDAAHDNLLQPLEEKSHQNDDDDNDDDTSTDLSLTPPSSMPLVLVDVPRLIGYRPSDSAEMELVQKQVQAALLGREQAQQAQQADDRGSGNSDKDDDIVAATDFDARVADLFESQAGRHVDTKQAREWGIINGNDDDTNQNKTKNERPEKWAHFAVVEYPSYLSWNHHLHQSNIDDDGNSIVVSTVRLWKSIEQGSRLSILPVDQLLGHVRDCSRALGWKAAMASAIRALARQELRYRQERQRRIQMAQWKEGRPEALEKLYTVRETIVHQLDLEKQKLQTLEEERETAVATRLREQSMRTGKAAGLQGLDFNTTNSVWLPDEPLVLLGEEKEQSEYLLENPTAAMNGDCDNIWDVLQGGANEEEDEEDALDNQHAWERSNEAHSDDDESYQAEDEGENDVTHQNRGSSLKRKAAAAAKSMRLQSLAQEEAAYKDKIATAQAEENAMREACTSEELRKVQAIVNALQDRLAKTDELLESIQEEEWAEEEGEEGHNNIIEEDGSDEKKQQELSLLDQILAMVLGAIPAPVGSDEKEHLMWKQFEHETIVMDWKTYFGRVPPGASLEPHASSFVPSKYVASPDPPKPNSLSEEQARAQLKESLGIIDNGNDDWDEWDDWTDDEENSEQPTSKPTLTKRPPARPGLRPGGRIS